MKIKKSDPLSHVAELARQAISEAEYPYQEEHRVKDFTLTMKWVSGGMSGGNCWGDSATSFYSDYTPKRFASLDKLIQTIVPDISFMNFRDLESKLIIEDSEYESEYYGNSTDYITRSVDLMALLRFFDENEMDVYE